MIKLARVATVAALLGGVVAGIAPTASASPAKTKVLETITVRAEAKTSATALGTIPKGTIITVDNTGAVRGGEYTACNRTERAWYPVKWNGAHGYVVAACIHSM
ncbi:SH3 domain-containing protein [Nocardia sp. NPDC052254]|uniref:SH3 domain-containing protein n=1 Tax=Nocardia sp. NPDC052254 TaxID=3155681 RepID=UPI003438D3A7